MSSRIQISDLLAHPGTARSLEGEIPISVTFPNASVDGEVHFELQLRSLTDGVVVRGRASAAADSTCTRCLIEWVEEIEVPVEAVFRLGPEVDADEFPIEQGGWIDLGPLLHDEVALGVPARPLCKDDCLGLCPTCGTDLNVEPCEGHGDTLESPFAALAQLLADEAPQKPES